MSLQQSLCFGAVSWQEVGNCAQDIRLRVPSLCHKHTSSEVAFLSSFNQK
jgi:hypothetical protein